MILENIICLSLITWLVVVTGNYLKKGEFKVTHFGFTNKNYYIMLLPAVAGIVFEAYQQNSYLPLLLFIVFAFTGVVGETMMSFWWQIFFTQRFWTYNVKTVYHRYTSWLNFIPWGLGGYLYYLTAERLTSKTYPGIEFLALTAIAILFLLQVYLFNLFRFTQHYKFREVNLPSFLVFYSPIFIFIFILTSIYGTDILKLAAGFALVGTVAEYLFGKACQLFVSKKLWDYNYWAVDGNHFTPLSIPMFCFGGFYFWIISKVLMQYLN